MKAKKSCVQKWFRLSSGSSRTQVQKKALKNIRKWFRSWSGASRAQAQMPPKAWAKVYGRKAIPTLRKLNDYASGLGKDEVQKLKTDLIKPLLRDSTMSDEEREQVREMADAVVNGGEQLGKYEFTWLTFTMGNLLLQSEEDTEADAERFRQLCVIYDDPQRRIKLKIKCPGCGRPLKGATQAMIGDVGVCPKCKTEFVIEQKG